MERIIRVLALVGLAGFLIITTPLVLVYLRLLWDKIVNPHIKNMNNREAFQFGMLALFFVIIDFFIAWWFIRKRKRWPEIDT